MVQHSGPLGKVVLGILVCFSISSWTVIFSKVERVPRRARRPIARFLRAFRKATGLEAVMVASEQFRPSPLVAVFDFGYEEVERQVKVARQRHQPHGAGAHAATGHQRRDLQAGTQHELAGHHRHRHAVSSDCSARCWASSGAFQDLGQRGSTSLRDRGAGHLGGADHHGGRAVRRHSGGHLLQLLRPHHLARSARAWTISRSSS